MKQRLLLALLLLTLLPSLLQAQVGAQVGDEFVTTAASGGSGKTWRYRVTSVDIAYVPLASTYLHQAYLGTYLTSLTVSQGTNAIPDYAFKGCTSLTYASPLSQISSSPLNLRSISFLPLHP
jgi:hypothetical protein